MDYIQIFDAIFDQVDLKANPIWYTLGAKNKRPKYHRGILKHIFLEMLLS